MRHLFIRWRACSAIVAVTALLGGCAGYSPGQLAAGTPVSDVVARMGEPTGQYTLADGARRLEFARGPSGRHTYMIDVDAEGRVTRWQQVLTEQMFNSTPKGITRQEVLQRLGRPSHEMIIPRRNERVWSYRYESPFCQWFQVSLDRTTDKVTETGYNVDPACDYNDDDRVGLLR